MRRSSGAVVLAVAWALLAGCEPTGNAGATGEPYYDYDRIGADAVKDIDTSGFDAL